MAPVLSFTAEEIWRHIPGVDGSRSLFFETWYEELAPHGDAEAPARWARIRRLREAVNKRLEALRADGHIGAGLDAEVVDLGDGLSAGIRVAASSHAKCVRCWHRREDVGASEQHPELCGRCVQNVDGSGETRLYA